MLGDKASDRSLDLTERTAYAIRKMPFPVSHALINLVSVGKHGDVPVSVLRPFRAEGIYLSNIPGIAASVLSG